MQGASWEIETNIKKRGKNKACQELLIGQDNDDWDLSFEFGNMKMAGDQANSSVSEEINMKIWPIGQGRWYVVYGNYVDKAVNN